MTFIHVKAIILGFSVLYTNDKGGDKNKGAEKFLTNDKKHLKQAEMSVICQTLYKHYVCILFPALLFIFVFCFLQLN